MGQWTRLTVEEFVARSRRVHGDKYDYSKTKYRNRSDEVVIICPKHGEFLLSPVLHFKRSRGCRQCKKEMGNKPHPLQKTTKQFIEEAHRVHGNKYDYSKVAYKNRDKEVIIICPKHGMFKMVPRYHVMLKHGCLACGRDSQGEERRKSREDFIAQVTEVHHGFYDYSQVQYKHRRVKIKIICPHHGPFEQMPMHHMEGQGCRRCAWEGNRWKLLQAEIFREIHEIDH